jgi:hypothetical protein
MTIKAEEIHELLAVAREILREHRRMALWADVYGRIRSDPRTTDTVAEARATDALHSFDNMFKEGP